MPTTPRGEAVTEMVAPGGGEARAIVATLVEGFHARPPLRVWSLIVTIFGDVVAPRGGDIWAGSLQELLSLMRIDAAAVRAALSRLARDGWLDRAKVGRLSYYALSDEGRRAFGPALARVYRRHRAGGAPRLRLVVLPEGEERLALRDAALKSGYGALGPMVLVGTTESPPLGGPGAKGLVHLDATLASGSPRDLVARAFDLAPLAGRYHGFLRDFTPLAEALERGETLSDEAAVVARVLLIHAFRRLILRDPMLSDDLLPGDWPGDAARALTARLYALLRPASERWIAANGRGRDGDMPPAGQDEAARFSD
jgi:phenylacetic acid degradation operon negative regulatory protein